MFKPQISPVSNPHMFAVFMAEFRNHLSIPKVRFVTADLTPSDKDAQVGDITRIEVVSVEQEMFQVVWKLNCHYTDKSKESVVDEFTMIDFMDPHGQQGWTFMKVHVELDADPS